MPKLPDNGGKVFRVRQLPSHVQLHELASLLHQALDCSGPIDHIRVFSLAPSIDSIDQHQTKVATIGFVTIPDVFSSGQHEWSFRMPGLAHTIVVDTHFLGFTPLNDVRPENHTVDCFANSGLASHPFGSWRPHNASFKTILNFIRSTDHKLPGFVDTNLRTGTLAGNLHDDSTEPLPPIGKIYDTSYEERPDYREQGTHLPTYQASSKMLRNEVTTFLDSLRKGETTHRYDQVFKAHELTFDWVFERGGVGLTEWLESGSGLFWINGKPGSGKSTVMKYIWDNRYKKGVHSAGERAETAEAKRRNNAGRIGGQEMGDGSSGDGGAKAQHSHASSESMSSENGNEERAHSEPSGETTAHFFFSHQGSEIQRSFEGLLHCVLYEIFSPGMEARHEIGSLRMKLGRDIPKAEADLAARKREVPRLEYEYFQARSQSQKESERQGRRWCERDERMRRLKEKRAEANAEADPEAFMEIEYDLIQEEMKDLQEERLKDTEDTKRNQLRRAKTGMGEQQSHVDNLKADYEATVAYTKASRVWRHENAQLMHSALQERLTLSLERLRSWTTADLEAALLQTLTQRQLPIKITLFLDALDEYAGNPKRIVDFLQHAIKRTKHSMTRLKICFTSRPWDVFNDRFINQPGFCMQDHTRSDIDNYAKARMRRHVMANTLSKDVSQTLRSRILERAEGVFLWVRLVLDTILVELVHGASPEELHRLLAAFPDGLEDLYIATLGRIESRYRKESYVMLEVVLRSEHLMEFGRFWETTRTACSIFDRSFAQSQSSTKQDSEYWHYMRLYDMVSRRIKSRCGGLLEIRNGVVQLMHQTVHDFLLQPGTMRLLVEPWEKLATFNGHSFLVQGLANRLGQPAEERIIALRGQADQREALSLVHSCMYHANQAELSTGMSQITLVNSVEDWNDLAELYFPNCAPSLPLAFAVVADLQIYMRDLLHRSPMCPRDLARLLHCAVEFHTRGNYRRGLMVTDLSGMIKLLLEFGADSRVFMHGMAPFQCLFRKSAQGVINNQICDDSSLSIAKVLLRAPGADPDGDVMMGTSSAHLAKFPRNGNDVLISCKPLHVAGGVSMIRLLLEAGAHVNGLNSEGQTPLDVFCSTQSEYADPREVEDASACKRQLRRSGGTRRSPLPDTTHTTAARTRAYPRPGALEGNGSSESLLSSTHLLHSHEARGVAKTDSTNISPLLWVSFCACLRQRRKTPMQGQLSSATPSKARYQASSQSDGPLKKRHVSDPPSGASRISGEQQDGLPSVLPFRKPRGGSKYVRNVSTGPRPIDETNAALPCSKPRGVPDYLQDIFPGPKSIDETPPMVPVGKPRGGPDYLKIISPDSRYIPDTAFQPVIVGSPHSGSFS